MFISKKHISRRTVLRGAGAALALPLLDAMFPALTPSAKAAAASKIPRFVGVFNPHGWAPDYSAMEKAGPLGELPFVLKPLEAWKDSVTIVSGLDATASMPPPGLTGGDHSRSAAVFSGVPPKKTVSDDIFLGTTIDQMIAQKYGQENALPSIQLGIEDQSALATCPWGYSCAYVNSVSWSGPTRPLPHEANPQAVFENLFGDGGSPQERIARRQAKASLLDAVTREVDRLNRNLGATDRTRLNEYLEDIREIERRLKNVAKAKDSSPEAEVPFGMPESFEEHINLMWDLQALAFQGDITRVSTLMYAHDVSMRAYPESGVTTANHAASHHGGIPKRVEDWAKINRFHVQCLPHFLAKLKATPDGDGSLLDHTLILWASNMGDSNLHSHKAVPNMLIGGAMGQHHGGRGLQVSGPASNLLLTALHMFGIEKESLGDSTGTISL
ncbi:MAG TPA: DUF1552 domain-containing protein [Bryobacteraceae bacterium]|nr:DUF1552 domain-containing protein [Bryobacteraceae bacterium]